MKIKNTTYQMLIIGGALFGMFLMVLIWGDLDPGVDRAVEQVLLYKNTRIDGSLLAHKIGHGRYIVGEWVLGRPVEPLWLVEDGKVYNINGLAAGRTPHLSFADINPVWAHDQWVKTRGKW